MEKWKCPKCDYVVSTRKATDIYHRCPKTRKNEWLDKVDDA